MAAGGERAGDVPAAAGSDDQRFGAGADVVGQPGPLMKKIVQVIGGQVIEIEFRDAGRGVGIDEDHGDVRFALAPSAMREKLFHCTNSSFFEFLALGVADVDAAVLRC